MIDILVLVSALAMMEGGPNVKAHEYGKLCITESLLKDYNDANPTARFTLEQLSIDANSWIVADDRLRAYQQQWKLRTGKMPVVSELASCWKAGFEGALRGRAVKYGLDTAKLYNTELRALGK